MNKTAYCLKHWQCSDTKLGELTNCNVLELKQFKYYEMLFWLCLEHLQLDPPNKAISENKSLWWQLNATSAYCSCGILVNDKLDSIAPHTDPVESK